jgi:hypothetical protein
MKKLWLVVLFCCVAGVSFAATITDPEALKFVKEEIRPVAEQIRALKVRADNLILKWDNFISTKIANTSDSIEDGRELEGVSRLIGQDINKMMTLLKVIQTKLNETGIANTVEKPCVQRLEIR